MNSNNISDNCCFEFGHAVSQRDNCIIPVLMENRLRDPNTLFGVGGASMGRLLYIDMTKHADPVAFEESCAELRDKILSFATAPPPLPPERDKRRLRPNRKQKDTRVRLSSPGL